MFNLKGKVAIVTGAASGIGLATAQHFAEKGAKVILAARNEEIGEQHAKAIRDAGGEAVFCKTDVSIEESVQAAVQYAVEKFGALHIIVNNAGIGNLSATHELNYDDYQRIIRTNQDGVFFGSKYAIQQFLQQDGGVIINVSSILGSVGEPGAFAYNASKGAVNTLTKSLAVEYASKNIRVNSVCPGYVESGMVSKEALGDYYDGLVNRHPIGRLGQPDEIAHAIAFLCENEFTTGINLLVDGGYTAV